MEVIILHPKTEDEKSLYQQLAKTLNTPYEIIENEADLKRKRPSDFFGTLSLEDSKALEDYVNKSRLEWNRNI